MRSHSQLYEGTNFFVLKLKRICFVAFWPIRATLLRFNCPTIKEKCTWILQNLFKARPLIFSLYSSPFLISLWFYLHLSSIKSTFQEKLWAHWKSENLSHTQFAFLSSSHCYVVIKQAQMKQRQDCQWVLSLFICQWVLRHTVVGEGTPLPSSRLCVIQYLVLTDKAKSSLIKQWA